jgi:hypothetical protein
MPKEGPSISSIMQGKSVPTFRKNILLPCSGLVDLVQVDAANISVNQIQSP